MLMQLGPLWYCGVGYHPVLIQLSDQDRDEDAKHNLLSVLMVGEACALLIQLRDNSKRLRSKNLRFLVLVGADAFR